jgi:hypothetical protein
MQSKEDVFALVRSIDMPRVHSRSAFIAYLKFLHATMRVTTDLFEEGAHYASGALAEYYAEKAVEEREHDEWMADDIAQFDTEPDVVDHAAAALCGAQYYYIRHVGAHVLLGYCIAMESDPMPMSALETLEQAFGEKACRTLRYHAVHDVDHAARLREVVRDHLDDLIVSNALITRRSFVYHCRDRMYQGG